MARDPESLPGGLVLAKASFWDSPWPTGLPRDTEQLGWGASGQGQVSVVRPSPARPGFGTPSTPRLPRNCLWQFCRDMRVPPRAPSAWGDPNLRDLPSSPGLGAQAQQWHLLTPQPREPSWECEPAGGNQRVGWILPKSHSESSEQGGRKDPSLLHSRLPPSTPTPHAPTQESPSKVLSIQRPRWRLASRAERGPED